MSHSNHIKEFLAIPDLNLTFEEDCFQKVRIDDQICFQFNACLTYSPQQCFHCHQPNHQSIIKWGWKHVSVLLNDVSHYKTVLSIKKQRFFCKACQRTFLAVDSISDRHCSIARKVKLGILDLLTHPFSLKAIAQLKHVSPSTVLRVMRSFSSRTVCPTRSLPEVLCFDEFKSVKQVAAAMSFVMMDGKTHQLLDIVADRQLSSLRSYFSRYAPEERQKVRLVVTDFYTPYRTLVQELFPRAQIVADRFHIAQHIGRTFLQHRVQRMKQFRSDQFQYKQLKRYWKLLQKKAWTLDYARPRWQPSFRAYLTETELVDRLLGYDEELKTGYQFYQECLYAIKHRDVPLFGQLLKQNKNELPAIYHPTIATFRRYKQEIKRALRVPYSNGPLECLNNHSKVLKRVSYGFRNFQNFRERIFLYRGKYFKRIKRSPSHSIKS